MNKQNKKTHRCREVVGDYQMGGGLGGWVKKGIKKYKFSVKK